MSGTLFVVATPIGNLDDLTPRAQQVLQTVSLIAAEDTRHTGRLLMHIGAKKRQIALHDHNEADVVERIITTLKSGDDVALVSDAGTPLVSDPGYRLVRAAHEVDVHVTPIPGPCAVTAALSAAGLPTDRFQFEGFPPAKAAARQRWLAELSTERRTLVFFESVHRIADSIEAMIAAFGAERQAFVGRELSKLHEQCVQGNLQSLKDALGDGTIVAKGEFVIVVEGDREARDMSLDADALLRELDAALPAKQAAAIVANVTGQKKNALYKRLLAIREA